MIRVLAEDSLWAKARIWAVVSDIVWVGRSSEYSGIKTGEDFLKYYKAYHHGAYLAELSKACLSECMHIREGNEFFAYFGMGNCVEHVSYV